MDDLRDYINDQLNSMNPDTLNAKKLKQLFQDIEDFAEDNYLI